jgi:hypothetical protein
MIKEEEESRFPPGTRLMPEEEMLLTLQELTEIKRGNQYFLGEMSIWYRTLAL